MSRQGLNTEKVVAEGLVLLDESGSQGLSLAALATRLGVKVPSLYKHIDGLDDLRTKLFRQVNAEFYATLKDASGSGQGRGAVFSMCRAYSDYVTSRKGRYEATAFGRRDTLDLNSRYFELLETLVAGCGVPDERLPEATFALSAVMRGVAQLVKLGIYGDEETAARAFHTLVNGVLDIYASEEPLPAG